MDHFRGSDDPVGQVGDEGGAVINVFKARERSEVTH